MADAVETKPISILEVEGFTVTMPYKAGHTCTEAEAKVLNQTRRENLGNNFRKEVQAFKDGAEGAAKSIEELIAAFTDLDSKYEFTIANVGGGSSRRLDPVEREARAAARDYIKTRLGEQGRKITDVPTGSTKEEWEDKVETEIERLSQTEEILAYAKSVVKAKSKSAGLQLGELGLGGGSGDAAPASA